VDERLEGTEEDEHGFAPPADRRLHINGKQFTKFRQIAMGRYVRTRTMPSLRTALLMLDLNPACLNAARRQFSTSGRLSRPVQCV
jgi:hypothetical protein